MTLDKRVDFAKKKQRRKHLIEWILTFLGIEATPFILAPYLLKTAQDVIRDLEAQAIQESGLTDLVDWVVHPEDSESGVCDLCQSLADNGPYVLALIPDTHPNCRCTLEPHIE
jgi:hypothetical protein